MSKIKKTLAMILAVVSLFSTVAIVANAAEIYISQDDYGYITPTDSKMQKSVSTVKMYGSYDYINFYVNAKCDDVLFFFQIYSDKNLNKLVATDYVYCETAGTYSYTPWIKLKGVFKTGTYYGIAYAAKESSDGSVGISEDSLVEFKISVNRTTDFAKQIVLLKSAKNTVNGPTITWYKHSNSATKYVIYRRNMNSSKWTKVATVNSKTLSYTDKSVKDKNGKYIYTVKALNKAGKSSRYQYEGLYCLFARAPKVSSVATSSDNRVQIKWNNTSSSARYNIYRKEGGGSWKLIKSNFKGTTYYDTTAQNTKNYTYTVKAVISTSQGVATSAYYGGKTVQFIKAPQVYFVEHVSNGIKVNWELVSYSYNYTVYRKSVEKGAKWEAITKVHSTVSSFVDTKANPETEYIYTVRSEGGTSRGSYNSKGIQYIPLEQPVFKTTVQNGEVCIEWENVEGAEGYYIYKRFNGGAWVAFAEIDGSAVACVDTPDKEGTYQYSVQAYKGKSKSSYQTTGNEVIKWVIEDVTEGTTDVA